MTGFVNVFVPDCHDAEGIFIVEEVFDSLDIGVPKVKPFILRTEFRVTIFISLEGDLFLLHPNLLLIAVDLCREDKFLIELFLLLFGCFLLMGSLVVEERYSRSIGGAKFSALLEEF